MSEVSFDAGVATHVARPAIETVDGRRTGPLPREIALGITRATAVSLVGSIATALGSINDYDAYRTWPMVVAFAVMVPCTVLCVAGTLLRPSDLQPIRVLAFATVALALLYGLAGAPQRPTLPYSPLHILLMPGMLIMPAVLGVRAAVASALLLGVVAGRSRIAGVGIYQGVCEGIYFAACALSFAALYAVVAHIVSTIDAAEAKAHRAAVAQAATRAALRAHKQFDDLVHNVLLSALLQAAMAQDPSDRTVARDLAAQAQQALDRSNARPRTTPPALWKAAVAEQAAALGLQVEIHQRGHPGDGAVARALLDATVEALNNVRRHAGIATASVDARFGAGAHVTITDHGQGFDPDLVDTGRYGLRVAIGDRLRAVGGTAHIRSTPGGGTQLTLDIPSTAAPRSPAAPELKLLRYPGLVLALVLIQVAYLAIGWHYLDTARLPALSIGLAILMLVMTFLLWVLPPSSRWWVPATVVLLIPVAFAVNTHGLGVPDWRTWYVGFADVGVATIAARFSPRFAIIATLGSAAGFAVTQLLAHPPFQPVILLNAWPQVLVFAVVGASLRRGMGRFQTRLAAANAQIERLHEQRGVDVAGADILAERAAELQASVVPMLGRIADGGPLTDAERAAAARTEAALRDRLRNPTLLGTVDRDLPVLVEAARRRGIRVELQTEPLRDDALLAVLARLLRHHLPRLDPTVTIRATAMGPATASISVTGGTLAPPAALPDGLVVEAISEDDFSMLSLTRPPAASSS